MKVPELVLLYDGENANVSKGCSGVFKKVADILFCLCREGGVDGDASLMALGIFGDDAGVVGFSPLILYSNYLNISPQGAWNNVFI